MLIQSIEAIPDAADRLDQQRRLARVLLDRIKREEPGASKPHAPSPKAPARRDRHVRPPDKPGQPVQIPDKATRPARIPDKTIDPVRIPDKNSRRRSKRTKRPSLSP